VALGVAVGAGVGESKLAGVASVTFCSFDPDFFVLPVLRFFVVRFGAGVPCGWTIEFPSFLKKSPMGLDAEAQQGLARMASTERITTIPLRNRFMAIFNLHANHNRSNFLLHPKEPGKMNLLHEVTQGTKKFLS
jgi:hypothetical protein